MKQTDQIVLIIFGVGLFVFLTILALIIRKLFISSFQKKCRPLGLRPSPQDSYCCIGTWQDAGVLVERCGTKYCNKIFVYMDLGQLPAEAIRNLGYFMQGLQTDYYVVKGFGQGDKEHNRIIAQNWRGPYLYSEYLRLNATVVDLKRICEALYQIRSELRRRIFSKFQAH
jgi:hypothetical protein